jgi:hypothetical protein
MIQALALLFKDTIVSLEKLNGRKVPERKAGLGLNFYSLIVTREMKPVLLEVTQWPGYIEF